MMTGRIRTGSVERSADEPADGTCREVVHEFPLLRLGDPSARLGRGTGSYDG
jgi:hypothetical protein